MPRQTLSAELEITAGLGGSFSRVFNQLDNRVEKSVRGLKGFSEGIKGMPKGDRVIAGIGRGVDKLTSIFRNTNKEISRTHDTIGSLRKQGRIYESLAAHSKKMGSAVQPWLKKIDQVNSELDKQAKKLDKLRIARERLNKASRGFSAVKESAAPTARRVGFAAAGAGIGAAYLGGRAFTAGLENYTEFQNTLGTLQAEGVAAVDIPGISDKVLQFARETKFSALEIGNLLVSMKKDGQQITAEMAGFGDLLKFAVSENKDLSTTWDVTRTYINATNTSLENAVGLQEQLSNATSLSKLQIEDFGFIAGKSLSTFAGFENLDTKGFLAIAGLLADTGVQAETVGIALREFPLVLAQATQGKLTDAKQDVFNMLGVNIADEKGRLRDITTILDEFNLAFKRHNLITAENELSTVGRTVVTDLFGKEYQDAIGKMITGNEKIAASMQEIQKVGTLDAKFDIHSNTLLAASKRFESARESFGLELFKIFDRDDTFIRFFDGATKGINRFLGFIKKHKKPISDFTSTLLDGLGYVGEVAIKVGGKIFDYFQARGPSIQQFFKDLWADIKGVWRSLEPLVKPVLGAFKSLIDTTGQFAGGNTKLLAWLAAAFVGWRVLKTPVMAANAALNLVLGSIGKVQSAWTNLRGLDAVGDGMPGVGRGKTQKAEVRGASKGLKGLKAPKIGPWAKWTSLLTGLGPILTGLFSKMAFLLPVIGAIGKGFAVAGSAIAGVAGAIFSLPAGVVVAVGAAVVGAGLLIYSQWDKVKNLFREVWGTIQVGGSLVWESLSWLGGSLANMFSGVGQGIAWTFSVATNFIKTHFSGLYEFLLPIGTGIKDFFTGDGVFGGIQNFAKSTVDFIKNQFGSFLDWMTGKVVSLKEKITGIRDELREKNEKRRLEHIGNPQNALKTALPTPLTPLTPEREIPDAIKGLETAEIAQFANMRTTIGNLDDKKFAGRAFKALTEADYGLSDAIKGFDPERARQLTEFVLGFNKIDPTAGDFLKEDLFKATLGKKDLETFTGVQDTFSALDPDILGAVAKEIVTPGSFDESLKGMTTEQSRQFTDAMGQFYGVGGNIQDYLKKSVLAKPIAAIKAAEKAKQADAFVSQFAPAVVGPQPDVSVVGAGAGADTTAAETSITGVEQPAWNLSRQTGVSPASVEYVNFTGVDALDNTLKSGFMSLLHIEDQILIELKKHKNVDIPPVIRPPDSPFREPVYIKKPPLPDVEVPPVEVSGIEPPQVYAPLGSDIQIPPPQNVSVPALHSTETHNTETQEGNVDIVQNITVNQLPNENAAELTQRILDELDRLGRASYTS